MSQTVSFWLYFGVSGSAYRYFSLSAMLKLSQVDMFLPLESHRIMISGSSLDELDDSEGFGLELCVLDAGSFFWEDSAFFSCILRKMSTTAEGPALAVPV